MTASYDTAERLDLVEHRHGYRVADPYRYLEDPDDERTRKWLAAQDYTRVDPMHARKMCAALQHATAGDRATLLRRESDVGHGARATSRAVDLATDKLAFLAAQTGLSRYRR